MVPIPRELVEGLKTKRLSVVNSLLSLKIIYAAHNIKNNIAEREVLNEYIIKLILFKSCYKF